PPLVGSRDRDNRPRYAWVVLNNYGNHPGYSSLVTGGVSGFEVELDPPFERPRNIAPSAGARLRDREITFRWSQVGEAANYFLYVSREEITAGGSRAFVPAWVAQTTLTAITCPAGAVLGPGRYIWKVLAASRQARGTISDTTSFFYTISSGEVTVYTRTGQDQILEFVQVQVEPIDGPGVPEFSTNDEGTFTRTFPVGVFRLVGRKEGYRDVVSEEFRVEDGGEYRVQLLLEPLPASIVGTVRSQQDSTPIPYSRVRAVEVNRGEERWAEANVSGQFQLLVEPGSYQLRAEARGFRSSSERGVQARAGATIDLDNRFGPFLLTPYQFTVSGYVHNTLGQPINSATVIASGEGGVVLRATTPESGTYSFRLGQGRWVMSAVKPGFYLESGDVEIEITDSDQEVNFTLVPQAAIVSGQVFMGGNLAQRVGEVWMIPSAGDVVIAPVSNNGAFSRGLAPGNWRLIPMRTGWSALDTINLSLGPGETVSGLRLRMVANPSVVEGRVGG
ncbi:MAG: carboxypeptidase regulatory-like domain-containing protein, partial [bacterium]